MDGYKKIYPVSLILGCFNVKRSTYSRLKSESEKPKKRACLVAKIEQLCMENQFIYGYSTITRLLNKRFNLVVNRKKVYCIMKERGWICRTRPKKTPNLGKPYDVTDNKLDNHFLANKPMEKLVTDITNLYFGNCKRYLSSIMDLYNREMVAYTISDCQDTDFLSSLVRENCLTDRLRVLS